MPCPPSPFDVLPPWDPPPGTPHREWHAYRMDWLRRQRSIIAERKLVAAERLDRWNVQQVSDRPFIN
jgi:hypothetical protein